MQDLALMHTTRERCRALTDFVDSVIRPLQKTSLDPFNGHAADVDSLGNNFTIYQLVLNISRLGFLLRIEQGDSRPCL